MLGEPVFWCVLSKKRRTLAQNLVLAAVVMVAVAILFRTVFGWHVFLFVFPLPFLAAWWTRPREGAAARVEDPRHQVIDQEEDARG